jgi:RNA polymerase-binding transcription factor DksA
MSGYAGVDDEAEHALIISENGVKASQALLEGRVLSECLDCGVEIPQARIDALTKNGMRCEYCVNCQDRNATIYYVNF